MCMRNAQSDVGQQAVTGFTPAVLPNRLRIYVARTYTRVHVRVHMVSFASVRSSARVHIYIYIYHTRTHTHTQAPPFSAAVPISGGTASRCIREAHRSYTPRGFPISLLLSYLRFSLFFHSIAFHRFTGCPRLYA